MPDFYDSGNGISNNVAAGFSSNSSRIVPRPDADNLLLPTGYDFLDEVTGVTSVVVSPSWQAPAVWAKRGWAWTRSSTC